MKKILLKMFFLLLIILLVSFTVSLLVNKEKELNATLELVQEFGEPIGGEDDILGLISSFFIDKKFNLYVADDAFKVIRKYSTDGKFLKKIGFGPGKGPGEFSNIHSIYVDSLFNVYAIDKVNSRLTVFDSSNTLLQTKKINFIPAQIVVYEPMVVDISGFPFTYQGNLIHRYNLKGGDSVMTTYGERPTDKKFELGFKSGNSGRLLNDKSGFIYFSHFYPYIIKKFSLDGKLLNIFEGNKDIAVPFRSTITNTIESPAGIRELAILPNNKLLVLFVEKKGDELIQYFHIWDSENGEFLGAIPCKDLGLNFVRFIRSDNEGNIYLDFIDPYPHINKYKLTFEQY